LKEVACEQKRGERGERQRKQKRQDEKKVIFPFIVSGG